MAGVAAGAFLAHSAQSALERELEPLSSRYFAVAGMFGAGVLMPAVLVLYGLFPDWSLMYLANPAHLPRLLVLPVLALLSAAAPALGFLAVQRQLSAREPWARRAIWIACGVIGGLTAVLGAGRLFTVALYDVFHAGAATLTLARSALFLPLMLITGAVVSVYVYALMHTRRHVELSRGLPGHR